MIKKKLMLDYKKFLVFTLLVLLLLLLQPVRTSLYMEPKKPWFFYEWTNIPNILSISLQGKIYTSIQPYDGDCSNFVFIKTFSVIILHSIAVLDLHEIPLWIRALFTNSLCQANLSHHPFWKLDRGVNYIYIQPSDL